MSRLPARCQLWKIAQTASMFAVRVLNSGERHMLDFAASIQILDLFPVRTLVLSAAYQHQNSAKEESRTHLNRSDQCRREALSE
jgi:hypothetical protein